MKLHIYVESSHIEDECYSLIEALETVKRFESDDKKNECYYEGLYDVVNQYGESYYLNPMFDKLYEVGFVSNGDYGTHYSATYLTEDYEEAHEAYESQIDYFLEGPIIPTSKAVYFGEYTAFDNKIVIHLDSSKFIKEMIDTYFIDINIEQPVLDCVIYRSGCDPEPEAEDKKMKKFYTADQETYTIIDEFSTVEEAVKAIKQYEEDDKQDGSYSENFYDVIDDEHNSYYLFN